MKQLICVRHNYMQNNHISMIDVGKQKDSDKQSDLAPMGISLSLIYVIDQIMSIIKTLLNLGVVIPE